jgi:hypothetical protein
MPACIRYRRRKAARCPSSCAKPQRPHTSYLGVSRAVLRSRKSAHGCQGGHGCEIHVPRAFPHAAVATLGFEDVAASGLAPAHCM